MGKVYVRPHAHVNEFQLGTLRRTDDSIGQAANSHGVQAQLTNKQISAYFSAMRRKAGTLIPIEQSILAAAMHLRIRGDEEFHGFRLAKEIKVQKDARLLTSHGTLYRALGRLEHQGYLNSRWEDPIVAAQQSRPRRKLYRLTAAGRGAISELPPDSELVKPVWALSC